jgi:hypothetical protein
MRCCGERPAVGRFRSAGLLRLLAACGFGLPLTAGRRAHDPVGGHKTSLANHAGIVRATYGLFSVADFLLVPAVLGLYLSLKRVGKNLMLVATGLMAVFIVVDLAITDASTLTIVTLTQHAAAAASAAERTAYMAAAHYGLATVPLANFYTYVVSGVGVLLISMVMLKGVFSKRTAYVGIVTGIVGIVAGFMCSCQLWYCSQAFPASSSVRGV